MADAAVFVGWGTPVRGREAKALAVFNEAMAYYARLQQEGKIESFEPVILQPHGGDLNGFVLLRGERSTLSAVVASDEFATITMKAGMIAENVGVVDAAIGTSLAEGMGRYAAVVGQLGG
jgi:hypothetical protein